MQPFYKKLRPDHWAWLHAKLAIVVWAISFYFFTPHSINIVLHYTLATLISVFTIVGLLISVVGLCMALSSSLNRARRGTNLEIAGLWISLTGPLSFFLTLLYIEIGTGQNQLTPFVALGYVAFSVLLVRLIIVRTFRKKVRG